MDAPISFIKEKFGAGIYSQIIIISITLFSFVKASTRCYMELCPFLVVFAGWHLLPAVATSVARGPTSQTSVDNSAPKFLKEEIVIIDSGQHSLSKLEANPFYSFCTTVWLSYTVIGNRPYRHKWAVLSFLRCPLLTLHIAERWMADLGAKRAISIRCMM